MAKIRKCLYVEEAAAANGWMIMRGLSQVLRSAGQWQIQFIDQGPHLKPFISDWSPDVIVSRYPFLQQDAEACGARFVNIGAMNPVPGIGQVFLDEARIAGLAAGHLFERCYKHCVYITGDTGKGGYSAFRHACLKNALGERGLECDRFTSSGLTGPLCRMKKRPLRRELAKYLKSAPKPLAVICDDHIGYNVYETAQSLNLQIPQDVALLGIGNDPVLCALTDPPLTSIDVSFHELGCSAGRLSLHLLDNRAERYLSETIEPGEVVLRGTTAISAGNDPLVEKAVEYIAQHIHEPLNVDRLLLAMQVSHTNLKERFRRELNRTPLAEIHRQKLDCLKQELHGGSRTVGALARRYGFSSAEHMTRFFRRNTGMTPSEYRAATRDSEM